MTPSELVAMPRPTTVAEAEAFVAACLETLGGGFHPDTRAAAYHAYVGGVDQGPTFPTRLSRIQFDRRIEACFALLPDIYQTTTDASSDPLASRGSVGGAYVRMLERMLDSGRAVLAASTTKRDRAFAMDSVRRLEIQLATARRAAAVQS